MIIRLSACKQSEHASKSWKLVSKRLRSRANAPTTERLVARVHKVRWTLVLHRPKRSVDGEVRRTAYTKRSHIIIRRYKTISELMLNEQIRDKEIRLVGEDGEQLGIMSAKDALKMAKEANLDLVKIAPTAKPPVCKIVDYGKYRYEQARREKEAKKKQKVTEVKEIHLSPNIDVNDLTTKANQARKFVEKGNKVKVALRFRGREMAHMATGKEVLDSFFEKLSDVAVVEKPAKLEGRSMIMVLAEKR